MKKLILITGILLSTSLWADMDKLCNPTVLDNERFSFDLPYVKKNCERNNIFFIYEVPANPANALIAQFCRFDRNVNRDIHEGNKEGTRYTVSCVLYDNKPRLPIVPKD